MLYPKNRDASLSKELFRNPTSEYRGAPFWAWNCELDKEELLRQLDVLKQMGMGGAHMHVRTGMATNYLSDEYMDLIQSCVEKCQQENMLAWLYDEDRWPSGAAGGIVTKNPEYRQRHLLLSTTPYQGMKDMLSYDCSGQGLGRSENGKLIACFDVVLDENDCLASYDMIDPAAEAKGWKWYVYDESARCNPWFNGYCYVDTLNPAAIGKFIDVTHRRYLETVGNHFGGIVPAIFSDEPQYARTSSLRHPREDRDVFLPWTSDLPQTFREACGEELIPHLPELLWQLPEGKISSFRYHFYDHLCERFTQAYADQCGAWCQQHGIMLTGHMMQEFSLLDQTESIGEAMRAYRGFQLPGIDMLCDAVELSTAKQAQSASRQYGREGVLSELYGVTGWDFDFRGHKFQGDWQAALGVTVRVHHLSWVSMKGEAKRDYPASINYQSPWWKDYALVEDHFARVNTAMTRGKAISRVGVIHPIESFWIHRGPNAQTTAIREQLEQNFQNVTRWLLTGCMDFDFICESLLPQQCSQGGFPLQVGEMAYDAIVVPGCINLRSTTLERLEAFAAAGGQLIFLGDAPELENAVESERGKLLWQKSQQVAFSQRALLEALEPVRMVEIRGSQGGLTKNLICQLRQDGDERWLFIAHCDKTTYNPNVPRKEDVKITLEGSYGAELYDTQTGNVLPVKHYVQNGKTVVEAEIYDLDSLLLHYTHNTVVKPPETVAVTGVTLPVPERVDFLLDEPNVLLLDKAEFALDDQPYHPETELLRADNILRTELGWQQRRGAVMQPWVVEEPVPEHRVRLRFTLDCVEDLADAKLALEDAHLAKIRCNGVAVTAQPDGWFADKSIGTVPLGTLSKGQNILEVVLPFGRRTNVEWCYLLGQFGVSLQGSYRQLVAMPEKLGFDDVTKQALAYYGGNITYHFPVTTTGGPLQITVPHYAGTAIRVEVDGKKAYIAYPPYRLCVKDLVAGEHKLSLTLLGNRQNCFGPVHLANAKARWIGPDAWRSKDAAWTESYRLKPLGILSAPEILELK